MKKNYKKQNSCANCAHCFKREEWDQASDFYCLLNAPPRPPCLSVLMDEAPNPDSDEAIDAWETWERKQRTDICGICDYWKKKI